MNRRELTEELSRRLNISGASAERSVNALLEIIACELEKGEKVSLFGFGTFEPGSRAARMVKHPVSGEKIDLTEQKTVKFRAGGPLKERINGGK